MKFILRIKRILAPGKYKVLSLLKKEQFTILDVGCGNDSPYYYKKYFPDIIYEGIDKDLNYNLSKKSINLIDKFFQKNLEKDDLNDIKDDHYDFIVISHVIEHLDNGYELIKTLSIKVVKNGYIYIEYPSEKSKNFPSLKGTLNFYDDPTHKSFYDIEQLNNILIHNNFKIIKSGIKRDILRIIFIPYMIIKSLFVNHYIRGSVFWDLYGFAEFILAKKQT